MNLGTTSVLLVLVACTNGENLSVSSPFDHLVKEYKLDKRSICVFDAALPEERLMALSLFMSSNDHWRYVIHDPHTPSNVSLFDDGNGIPWKSWSDPVPIQSTVVGLQLKNLVQSVDSRVNNKKSDFVMNEIYSALIRRGDRTNLHREGDKNDNSYVVAIFNNIVWRKNSYGELLFHDDDGEIMASIRPKFGRIVVWHSSITYVIRPPSIAQLTTENVLFAHFSSNTTKNAEKLLFYKQFVEELKRPPDVDTWLAKVPTKKTIVDKVDAYKHLTMMKKNKKGHFVAVFDGLFEKALLSELRSWTIRYGKYYFDGSQDASSDNVQWIAGINVGDFVKTDLWPVIHEVAKLVSNSSEWYPYDVACNLIRNYDHTRFHLDTTHRKEKEMTFLLYLSPNWTAADYGETAFMETNDDDPKNEYVAEVVPTFGRAVIFDGNFPHSAHPPSVTHYAARYTLAVKLSYTKLLAVRKTFHEESRNQVSLGQIKDLFTTPKYAVAMQKVMSVVEHLSYRNLQRKLESGDQDDEEDDESDEETAIAFPLGDANEDLDEVWTSLSNNQKKMVLEMIKFHDLTNAPTNPDKQIDLNYDLDAESRSMAIKKWTKMAGNNADVLNDYLDLYLRQRMWIMDYVDNKMISLL